MKKEIAYINNLIKNYPRALEQINYPFHSDAEILKLPDGHLGVSVDAVSEEIGLKLIYHPETLGWMTVTASVSDLSAIGLKTQKVSLLLKSSGESKEWEQLFIKGATEAAAFYQISETEIIKATGAETLTACTAFGFSKNRPSLSRVGLNAGDALFLTGPIGLGNATALANITIR